MTAVEEGLDSGRAARVRIPRGARPALVPAVVPVDIACALVALVIAAIAIGATLVEHGGRVSVLVHMAESEPLAAVARADPDFAFVSASAHYDGVYFYAIARDPFATGRIPTLIDLPANRYGHPAYGWAAAIVSLGQVRLLPVALLLVSLASLFIAAVAASALATRLRLSPWLGLAVGLNPGLIYATTADTAEVFGSALLLTSLLAWLSKRRAIAAILIVPLCLAKEPLLAVPVGLAAWEVLQVVRRRTSFREARRAVLLLLPGPAVFVAWYAYVHGRLGAYPFEQGLDRLSIPFTGWADTLSKASMLSTASFDEMQVGQAAVPLLAVAFGAILVGTLAALRLRSPLDPVYLLSAALMASLGWLPLLYPKDLIRISSFVVLLLPFVLAFGSRQASTGDLAEREVRNEGHGGRGKIAPRHHAR